MHKVVFGGISDNMSALVQSGKYGAINTTDPTKMGYYVVKLSSETYKLQDEKQLTGKS